VQGSARCGSFVKNFHRLHLRLFLHFFNFLALLVPEELVDLREADAELFGKRSDVLIGNVRIRLKHTSHFGERIRVVAE
jgi:hypothetical protein